jgi:hypothetical protein
VKPEFAFMLMITSLGTAALSYLFWRGFARDEFRMIGRSGWYRFKRRSFDWWLNIAINGTWLLMFVALFFAGIYGAFIKQ